MFFSNSDLGRPNQSKVWILTCLLKGNFRNYAPSGSGNALLFEHWQKYTFATENEPKCFCFCRLKMNQNTHWQNILLRLAHPPHRWRDDLCVGL